MYVYYDANNSFYTMDVNSGNSFISIDGIVWDDFVVSGNNFLASIRAYTNNLDYMLVETSNSVVDNKFVVIYDYSNISDTQNISYNIYKEKYSNSLNKDFEITNNIETEKSIVVGLTDQSSEGDYILLVQYNDIKLITKFSVSLDKNDELFFGKNKNEEDTPGDENENDDNNEKPEDDNNEKTEDENNNGDIDVEIEDNPLNDDVNDSDKDSEDEEIISNPKTGSKEIILIVVFIITLGIVIGTNNYIKNKNNI